MKKPTDISRGIRLRPETWKAFERLRDVHGSYDKALTQALNGKASKCPECQKRWPLKRGK